MQSSEAALPAADRLARTLETVDLLIFGMIFMVPVLGIVHDVLLTRVLRRPVELTV